MKTSHSTFSGLFILFALLFEMAQGQSITSFSLINGETDPYSIVQAEDFSEQSGIQLSNSGGAVGYVNNGDYIQFDNVTFGRGPLSGQITASSNTAGGTVEFRIGSPQGNLIATAKIPNTGGWTRFLPFDIAVIDPNIYADGTTYLGNKTLYLVFKGGSGFLLDVDNFIFEDSDVIIEDLRFTNCPTKPLTVGDTIDLDVIISPSNTTNQFVAFVASDGTSVDYISGKFTASAPGIITVSATSFSDGSVYDVCTITIKEKDTSFDPYNIVQAEDFSTQSGIQLSNSGAAVGYVNNGDYIQFDNVSFGRGPLSGQIIASSNTTGGTVEFRIGSTQGNLIATAKIPNTGGWTRFHPFDIEVIDPNSYANGTVYLGNKTLFLVFKGGSGFLLDVDRFIFKDSDVIIEDLSFTNCPSGPLTVGDTIDLDVLITPSNTANQTIAFTASDGSSINYLSGEFIARAPGEITVTATSFSNGSVFAVCTITIKEKTRYFDPYSIVQAEDYSMQNGIQVSNSGAAVGYVNNGDYIQFGNVTFGRGPKSGQIIASSNTKGGTVEFRTDSPQGNLIATAEISNTGGWKSFQPFDIEVIDPKSYAEGTSYLGNKTLYLVFKGGSGFLLDVDRFIFEDSEVVAQDLSLENELRIFPNPASTILNIPEENFKDENSYDVHIMTMDGVKMMTQKVSKSINELNIRGLSPGTYLVIFEGSNQFKQKLLRVK
ncbi:Por secretion system C-terminal sorting domain-containing protein [Aquiflexum balticum DSM 16537]|uniref:Por secretion system C-terminal sorting domain-containing protein n=1 Tax=Aquiflexum balticum DSM 16537 TaxID=758820 RepID=A0A1W2H5H7_9BACT|nr:carbohydrate-binding protein [Aquiflexum balticum]SMD43726.1 Por secretion system C-terminal sorting domain-containing protein [Aquiflexum balticum DSM 16537]